MALAILSPARPQISTTLLYRSPFVTKPWRYCPSISFTSSCASANKATFSFGISISSTQMEIPPFAANAKPVYIKWSAKITVSRKPHKRNEALISLEISFFFNALLMYSNGKPLGKCSLNKARPTVVS